MSIFARDPVAAAKTHHKPLRSDPTRNLNPLYGATGIGTFAAGSVEVLTIPLVASAETVRHARTLLSKDEHERADRFIFDKDRNRFAIARAGLRQLLAARLDVDPESVKFSYGHYGKPALARRFSRDDLRFSVSHSANLAVYALARGMEVGIDVEKIRALPDADHIATRFFSRGENESYRALDPIDRPLGFFNCWTRKEAYIKAIGEGLSHPLDSFEVTLSPKTSARFVRIGGAPGDLHGWGMESFIPAPQYVAAVVFKNEPVATKIEPRKLGSVTDRY